jgi:hypothetical protein
MVSKKLPDGSSKTSFDSLQYEKKGYLVVRPRGNGMTESKPASSLQKEIPTSKQNKPHKSLSGYGIVPDV